MLYLVQTNKKFLLFIFFILAILIAIMVYFNVQQVDSLDTERLLLQNLVEKAQQSNIDISILCDPTTNKIYYATKFNGSISLYCISGSDLTKEVFDSFYNLSDEEQIEYLKEYLNYHNKK